MKIVTVSVIPDTFQSQLLVGKWRQNKSTYNTLSEAVLSVKYGKLLSVDWRGLLARQQLQLKSWNVRASTTECSFSKVSISRYWQSNLRPRYMEKSFPGYKSQPPRPVNFSECFHMTSRRTYWCRLRVVPIFPQGYSKARETYSNFGVPKQWNGGHAGVLNQSFGSWTLFLCKRFLLFQ